jgi:hypothetical protein
MLVGSQNESNHLKDLDVDRNTILKCMLNVQNVRCGPDSTGWLRLVDQGGFLLNMANDPSESVKGMFLSIYGASGNARRAVLAVLNICVPLPCC